jgi:hypothetical protein
MLRPVDISTRSKVYIYLESYLGGVAFAHKGTVGAGELSELFDCQ